MNINYIGNPFAILDRNRPRNIVFYGRVSTEHEAQLSALENQMQWYDDQLKYHPNWNVIGRYIDEGITGTQAKKRPAFLQMLDDARKNKFDLIVTREVCRFARNTVDTLTTTRELKNLGIEVFFVEDNIWTMDGDGELRLTIMATLAQEESRKVSERVRAGQHISREKGTLYGSGNILGYDRRGDTYVINSDQAETVRMIYEMYIYNGMSTTKIADELTRMNRLNASGINKWSHGVISRVLNNQTYMGIMAYGKSYTNNYLDQKRFNNRDSSTYICVKGDFPPIVSEEEWHRAQDIKSKRVKEHFDPITGKKTKTAMRENKDLWGSLLQCTCGSSFRKNAWHRYKDRPNTYGYQCYNILNNGSAKKRREAGADTAGYCDQPMIGDWKLELMAKKVLEQVFDDQKDLIDYTIGVIQDCLCSEDKQDRSITTLNAQIERVKRKKEILLDMRTDGEITKEEFLKQKEKLDHELRSLMAELEKAGNAEDEIIHPEWNIIRDALEEVLEFDDGPIHPDLVRKFVQKIVPDGKNNFRWYLKLDTDKTNFRDVIIEGRKNNAVVLFCDENISPDIISSVDVFRLSELESAAAEENDSCTATLDRLLSRKCNSFA